MRYKLTNKRKAVISQMLKYAQNEITAMDDWEIKEMFGLTVEQIDAIINPFIESHLTPKEKNEQLRRDIRAPLDAGRR